MPACTSLEVVLTANSREADAAALAGNVLWLVMRSVAVTTSLRSVAEIGCKQRYVEWAGLSTNFFDSETEVPILRQWLIEELLPPLFDGPDADRAGRGWQSPRWQPGCRSMSGTAVGA